MSVMYATPTDLASYLQKDLDTSSATLALQIASRMFSVRADTMFAPTTTTYQVRATGGTRMWLPFRPVTAVSQVRVVSASAGTSILTDYTRIKNWLYRPAGFGAYYAIPPDMVEVDLTHGYAAAGDDVRGAVLETAATVYQSPDATVVAEQIDDYRIQTAANAGGLMLTESAAKLADFYRGTFVA